MSKSSSSKSASCGARTFIYTLWTNAKPGRRFVCCDKCGWIHWADDAKSPLSEKQIKMIPFRREEEAMDVVQEDEEDAVVVVQEDEEDFAQYEQ
ncbi:hypothetical protein QVD17_30989 [Tagetes erecta]|uniref:Uncharacterized protein n=1 Tax=Tagetes erecta TaxID=13708 RepID=A0AAD8NNS8_TARER|nr:hypothetical protein QVD17_30989 [Tagetes erecta]